MGQKFSHLMRTRQSTATPATPPSSSMLVQTEDKDGGKSVLLGDTAPDGCENPQLENHQSLSDQGLDLSIELVPHQHTLFCERKERVCAAAGKIQELEYLQVIILIYMLMCYFLPFLTSPFPLRQLRGPISKLHSFVWVRSESPDDPGLAIIGSDGQETYQLCVDDVGCYIGVKSRYGGENEAETQVRPVGPVLAGPPRLLGLEIKGACTSGYALLAESKYIGGIEGSSEFWWLRIKNGKREQVSEPREIGHSNSYAACESSMAEKGFIDPSRFVDLMASPLDPRIYILSADDVGCEMKVKCRPTRSDGVKGEVFTSKACQKVITSTDINIDHVIEKNEIIAVSTVEETAIAL